jgi:hypothetical protein
VHLQLGSVPSVRATEATVTSTCSSSGSHPPSGDAGLAGAAAVGQIQLVCSGSAPLSTALRQARCWRRNTSCSRAASSSTFRTTPSRLLRWRMNGGWPAGVQCYRAVDWVRDVDRGQALHCRRRPGAPLVEFSTIRTAVARSARRPRQCSGTSARRVVGSILDRLDDIAPGRPRRRRSHPADLTAAVRRVASGHRAAPAGLRGDDGGTAAAARVDHRAAPCSTELATSSNASRRLVPVPPAR